MTRREAVMLARPAEMADVQGGVDLYMYCDMIQSCLYI